MVFGPLATTALFLAGACTQDREPVAVPLARLVSEQESFEGKDVETRGTVRAFGEDPATRHYVVEDARANRVQLVPDRVADGYVGREVMVAGEFGFDERRGRFIRIDRISPSTER
ncbi:MAG: hypothetical protein ACRDHO_01760 [Actinomycetota bacterium]|jgi:hypothetical protein